MKYWWVNQKQTHKEEIPGGYMWSPKTKADGSKNTFYDNMTKVNPGDIVFSYFDKKIQYIGIITSHGYPASKPDFKRDQDSWGNEGWKVSVDYKKLENQIMPKEHIKEIRPFLPEKYSPLQKDGNGLEIYLTYLSDSLALKLLKLIGEDLRMIFSASKEHTKNLNPDKTIGAEDDDNNYQRDVQKAKPKRTEEKPQKKPSKGQVKVISWKTDPSIAKQALLDVQYHCEADASHVTFVSKNSGENFVEAHHLIPMRLQDLISGDNDSPSLDVSANIIALCPNCHRKFHHSTDKVKSDIVKYFYNMREKSLKIFGIKIRFDILLQAYLEQREDG
jgi:hypothetical protein